MSTFAVMSDKDNEVLFERISKVFSKDSVHLVDPRLILISSESDLIAKSIYEKIEGNGTEFKYKDNADIGRFVIFSINSYYGLHYKSMWDWLGNKVK